jgi:hypothetical protein
MLGLAILLSCATFAQLVDLKCARRGFTTCSICITPVIELRATVNSLVQSIMNAFLLNSLPYLNIAHLFLINRTLSQHSREKPVDAFGITN